MTGASSGTIEGVAMPKDYRPWLVYAGLGLAVMLPLLMPGYILTLDMVFTPHPPLPVEVGSSYLFHAGLHFLSHVIPADFLQKLILFGIFLFSGLGMHQLAAYSQKTDESTKHLAAYAAGIIYIINPFVYARFMAGQYAVLLGYMLLPFFAYVALRFMEKPDWRRVLVLVALLVAISIVSIHTVGLAAALLAVITATHLWGRHDSKYLRSLLSKSTAGGALVIALSLYWIIPFLQGKGASRQISGFSDADRAAFATDGGLWSVLQLQGFWMETRGLFIRVGDPLPLSGLAQALLWIVVIIGVTYIWRRQRRDAVLWGVVAALAALLALGTGLNDWLSTHIPLFAGYREPHKFVALLALSYAIFAAYGVAAIATRTKEWQLRKYTLAAAGALLPFWVTPTMLWGFNGQLRPSHYPADWHTVNQQLNQDKEQYKVLFLPWHLYMRFSFTGRIIAEPATKFFDKPVIVSTDPEFAGLPPVYQDDTSRQLNTQILPGAEQSTKLGAELAPLGIKYILLAKDNDYQKYDYLNSQSDLVLITETDHLRVYRNKAFKQGGGHAAD